MIGPIKNLISTTPQHPNLPFHILIDASKGNKSPNQVAVSNRDTSATCFSLDMKIEASSIFVDA
jgi:hypothetical protein